MGRYQSGQLGQTVNLLANAFVGSNPALPTSNGYGPQTWRLEYGYAGLFGRYQAGVAQLVEH